jgi:hypothetical protein
MVNLGLRTRTSKGRNISGKLATGMTLAGKGLVHEEESSYANDQKNSRETMADTTEGLGGTAQ